MSNEAGSAHKPASWRVKRVNAVYAEAASASLLFALACMGPRSNLLYATIKDIGKAINIPELEHATLQPPETLSSYLEIMKYASPDSQRTLLDGVQLIIASELIPVAEGAMFIRMLQICLGVPSVTVQPSNLPKINRVALLEIR